MKTQRSARILRATTSLIAFLQLILPQHVRCQSGPADASAIPAAASRQEAYGINYSFDTTGTTGTTFFTRHHRLGESTGIGGSTIDTTSPTSESSPAFKSNPSTYGLANPIVPQNPTGLSRQTFSERMKSPASEYERQPNQLWTTSPALQGSGVSPGTFTEFSTPFRSSLPGAWKSTDYFAH